jgi:DNA polymerase-3 subunit alpha
MSDISSVPTLKLADVPPAAAIEKLTWERELLGLYLSGHPLDRHREAILKQPLNIAKIKANPDTDSTNGVKDEKTNATMTAKTPAKKDDESVVFAAIVEDIRPITTKKGEPMLFVRLADFSGTIEAVVFPRVYVELRNLFVPEQCLAIKGKISERNGERSIIVDRAKRLV